MQDLYELVSLVAPGLLGTPAQFRQRHTGAGTVPSAPRNLEVLGAAADPARADPAGRVEPAGRRAGPGQGRQAGPGGHGPGNRGIHKGGTTSGAAAPALPAWGEGAGVHRLPADARHAHRPAGARGRPSGRLPRQSLAQGRRSGGGGLPRSGAGTALHLGYALPTRPPPPCCGCTARPGRCTGSASPPGSGWSPAAPRSSPPRGDASGTVPEARSTPTGEVMTTCCAGHPGPTG